MKIYMFVGLPNSGKTTYIQNKILTENNNLVLISRDDILVEYGKKTLGENKDYTEIFKTLTNAQQDEINKIFNKKLEQAQKENKDIVIDMTLLTKKARAKLFKNIHRDYKIDIYNVIAPMDDIIKRNQKRKIENGKFVPVEIIIKMAQSYENPEKNEDKRIEHIYFIINQ